MIGRPTYWQGVKRLNRLCRRHRRKAAARKLPRIREFCEANSIKMLPLPNGHQFRKNEYVITWHPSTNSIQIQYALPGHNKTVAFSCAAHPSKPRILVALEEVVELGTCGS